MPVPGYGDNPVFPVNLLEIFIIYIFVVYFNPDSAEDMAEQIYQLWNNNNVKESLVRKGYERAKLFTPKNTAEKTITAYRLAKHKKMY